MTMHKILLSSLLVALPLSAFAQDRTNDRRRVVLPPSSRTTAPNPAPVVAVKRPSVPGLSRNVTLSVSGMLQGLLHVEVELTGSGPEFTTDYSQPAPPDSNLPPTIISISAALTEIEGGYYVSYSLGARVPEVTNRVTSSNGQLSASISYRDLKLKSAVRIKMGESVVISRIGGKPLVLKISEAG